jgi:5-methylcytosine-specific restriction endonuclease McrA
MEILNAYGNQCAICGQTKHQYLEIDHIYVDGAIHRKERNGQRGVYLDIKNQGFPKDRFQILCANCHTAKTRGYDPRSLL